MLDRARFSDARVAKVGFVVSGKTKLLGVLGKSALVSDFGRPYVRTLKSLQPFRERVAGQIDFEDARPVGALLRKEVPRNEKLKAQHNVVSKGLHIAGSDGGRRANLSGHSKNRNTGKGGKWLKVSSRLPSPFSVLLTSLSHGPRIFLSSPELSSPGLSSNCEAFWAAERVSNG